MYNIKFLLQRKAFFFVQRHPQEMTQGVCNLWYFRLSDGLGPLVDGIDVYKRQSIMIDGSHYPIAENVEKTTELVKACLLYTSCWIGYCCASHGLYD